MDNKNWAVVYGGDPSSPLSLTFNELNFVQTFHNAIGVAEHHFTMVNLPEIASSVEGETMEFEITSVDGDKQKWKHQIVDFNIGYEQEGGFPVVIKTMDLKVKLNIDDRNKAHRFEKTFTDPLKTVVENAGLVVGKTWEDQDILEEFKVLRQINMTDYVWITQHVVPRMKGAYCLYASREDTVNFHSTGFDVGTYSVPEGMAGGVYETNNLIDATMLGGGKFRASSYDPLTKLEIRPEEPVGESITPNFGSTPPAFIGLRQMVTAFSTQDGVRNYNETRNKLYAYHRYGVSVMMEGHIPDGGWWEPKVFDLSATKYKSGSPQSGVLHSISHTIKNSQYRVLARCAKNLKN